MSTRFLVLSAFFVLLGCAQPQQAEQQQPHRFKTVANVKEIMESLVAHMAEDVFAAVGTIISEKGTEEIQPRTDEEWEEVRYAAMGLAETGNLLMFEGRAKDRDDWMKFSEAMIDRSVNAAKAAEAKDPERLFRAAGELFDSCNACHNKYIPPDPTQK